LIAPVLAGMTAPDLAVAVIIAFAAAVQSVSGFGFSLLAVPLLSLAIDPKVAVVLTSVSGLPLMLSIAFSERRKVVGRIVAVFTVAAFAGMPLGLWILGWVDARVLEGSIAVVVIVLTVLLARGFSVADRSRFDVAAGLVSGILATSTSTNGPPIVFALQAKGLAPAEFRGTLSMTFVFQGLVAVAAFAIAGRLDVTIGRLVLIGLPGLAAGYLAGAGVRSRIDPQRFRALVLGLFLATGVSSLVNVVVR